MPVIEKEKVKPVKSIVSTKDYRKAEKEYFVLNSKQFKEGQEQSKNYNDQLIARYEAALTKGVRKSNFTKPKRNKNRKAMAKASRKNNWEIKGRSQKQGK
jgi:hypothetical protein